MNASSLLPLAARRDSTAGPVRPQLTSLVDMLTILLVFLLKSFSVEGELMTPAPGLQLPTSSSRDQALPEVSVEVTRAEIRVDGRPIVAIAELDVAGRAADAADAAVAAPAAESIPALAAALAVLADDTPGETDGRAITIQCDRDQEFRLLERVMATCSGAGFSDFSLLVTREDS